MGFSSLRCVAAVAAGFSLITIASASALQSQAVIRGVLYDDVTGSPLRGTVMLVDPSTDAAVVHTTTDSAGQFSLQIVQGTVQIAAVRPGYKSVLSAPIPLQKGERLTVRVPIAEQGDPQHRIGVTEHIRPGDGEKSTSESHQYSSGMESFYGRKIGGIGLHYDRAALDKSTYHTLGEFLQNVPGFRVGDPTSTNTMSMARSQAMVLGNTVGATGAACHVGWFIDGHRMDMPGRSDPITDGLGGMQLETIEGVEVFRGLSEMPSEFASPDLRCGAIAIWTRRG